MFIALTLIAILVPNALSADCKCGRRAPQTRIVGGDKAAEGAFPWMAAMKRFIVLSNGQIMIGSCGGSIINSEWVLSAAHCVEDEDGSDLPPGVTVVNIFTFLGVGMNNIAVMTTNNLLERQGSSWSPKYVVKSRLPRGVHHADRIISHERYDNRRITDDIALLHVSQPFDFSPKVVPICLETAVEHYPTVEIAGWGNIRTGVSGGPDLLHVTTREVRYEDCSERRSIDPRKQLCIQIGAKGTCQGDSGGPFVVNKRGIYYQIALVSYGGGRYCEDPRYQDVATRVSYYNSWIKSNANSGYWCSA